MGLSDISNLETLNLMYTIPIERPKVEYVFYILDTIDVAVNIDVIIIGINSSHKLSVV